MTDSRTKKKLSAPAYFCNPVLRAGNCDGLDAHPARGGIYAV